jgi:hypothetical protein
VMKDRVRMFWSDHALIMFQVLNHTLDHPLHGLLEYQGLFVKWIERVINLIHVNLVLFFFFFFLRTLFFFTEQFKS